MKPQRIKVYGLNKPFVSIKYTDSQPIAQQIYIKPFAKGIPTGKTVSRSVSCY